jgi:hypothetical protein
MIGLLENLSRLSDAIAHKPTVNVLEVEDVRLCSERDPVFMLIPKTLVLVHRQPPTRQGPDIDWAVLL